MEAMTMPSRGACWSCRGPCGEADFCPTCEAIQPPVAEADHFRVLGMERRFELDLAQLERNYRERQQRFHPDRFANRSATERRFSLEQVTRLNEAFQALKTPLGRADHLLALYGHVVPAGSDGGSGGASAPEFLLEVMEWRERLAALVPTSPGAEVRLQALRQEVRERQRQEESAIGREFGGSAGIGREFGGSSGQEPLRLGAIATGVDRLRYLQRLMEELDRQEEAFY
ncbi:MAG: Fe-S protein assembly co-chaperone HscB [Magnetococcales bacterium]|nr:Fe-S protein assembly co-chaperone HscB [Magnetococcales bacterium]